MPKELARIAKSPDERRHELIACAQKLFYSKGYERTTVGDIVDELGVAKGTFYYYFDSKLAILEAMVDEMIGQSVALLHKIVADETLPVLEKWARAFQVVAAWKAERKAELLATLHARVPWVPFFTPWVRRHQALVELARATEIAPSYPGNQLLLALTLLELTPQRRAEAIELLEAVARIEPDPEERVEQLAMRQAARERLQQHRTPQGTASPRPRRRSRPSRHHTVSFPERRSASGARTRY